MEEMKIETIKIKNIINLVRAQKENVAKIFFLTMLKLLPNAKSNESFLIMTAGKANKKTQSIKSWKRKENSLKKKVIRTKIEITKQRAKI